LARLPPNFLGFLRVLRSLSASSGHWAIKAAQASLMRSENKMKVPGGRAAMWSWNVEHGAGDG